MRTHYKMLALFCLALAAPARAEPPAEPLAINFIGKYYFSWAGLKLGDLVISISETEGSYKLRMAAVSGGMVNWFTRHESDTEVSGKRSANGYHPVHYESNYKTKKKPRHIRLQFDAKGHITEELNEPPENRAIRPEVPAEEKDGSYDPLTGFMVMRAGVSPFKAFDAKRLYEVTATDKGTEKRKVLGAETILQHYVLSRTPIAGMTEKETKEYKDGEPPLHFYFTTDERRIPAYMTMPIFMGNVVGTLTKECETWEECK